MDNQLDGQIEEILKEYFDDRGNTNYFAIIKAIKSLVTKARANEIEGVRKMLVLYCSTSQDYKMIVGDMLIKLDDRINELTKENSKNE